jgi:hypothetical protein
MLKAFSTALLIAFAGVTASFAQIVSGPNGIPIMPTTPPDIANPGLTRGPPGMHIPQPPPPAVYAPGPAPSANPLLNSSRPVYYPRRYVVRPDKQAKPVVTEKRATKKSAKTSRKTNKASRKTNNARANFGVKDICRGC